MAADLLGLVAVVIGLAVVAEMLGNRLGLPTFLFYIVAGLAVGPVGVGLVHHNVFGENLGSLVGFAVAIIVFHSGASITREDLRAAPRSLLLLVTVGVVVTVAGSALLVHLVMAVSWGLALLVGVLLVATGTTVIEPLLEAVPVRDRLASMLEIEATVTEVSAGVLAITVFNAFTFGEPDTIQFASLFVWVFGVGVLVGLLCGGVAWLLFRLPDHAPGRAPQHASVLYLAIAVVTYAVAESITQEAGVAAVATAGVLLGNADLPYEEAIGDFEESVTTFIIPFIFVVLTSFADPDWLATVGVEGVLVALGVIVLVRPLAVFLSTAGSVLSRQEKLFLSTASPRGIIPAGVGTLLALQIQDTNPTAAAYITGTVLLVILLSAVVEGVFAGRVADRFGLGTDVTVVVGGGQLGLALASRHAERGERVVVVEPDWDALETARLAGFTAYHGDGTDESVLRTANVEKATRVVVVTDDDDANYEIATLVRSTFDVESVLVRVNRVDNRGAFEDLDVDLLTGSQLDLWALEHLVDHSAPDWLLALIRTGGVGSLFVDEGVEAPVADVDQALPERAFVIALTRDGTTSIPEGSEPLAAGDRLTLLGRSEAIEEAVDRHAPLLASDAIDHQSPDAED